MTNLYYDPEKFGLRTVGEVDFSSGSYEFDILAVFQDVETGKLFYAEDSGCSCPSPFEAHDRQTLTPLASVDELRSRIKYRREEHAGWGDYLDDEDVSRLLARAREAVS